MPSPFCSHPDARLVGDPVDTLTGANTDRTLDVRLVGPFEFRWIRHYDSSRVGQRYALGWGHTHHFDRTLRFDIDGLCYAAPLDNLTGFPALTEDGSAHTHGGLTLVRLSPSIYQVRERGGAWMEFAFDDLSKPAPLARLVDDSGHDLRLTYSASGLLERIRDSKQRIVRLHYDDDGRLDQLTVARPDRPTEQVLMAYEYDADDNLVAGVDAYGNRFTIDYDGARRVVQRTDRNGYTFHFTFDDRNRCIRSEGADQLLATDIEYLVPGRVTKVTRADGGVWQYFFEEGGTLARIVDPLGGTKQFLRDREGRVTAEIEPDGRTTPFVFEDDTTPVGYVTPAGRFVALPAPPPERDPSMHQVAENAAEYDLGNLIDVDEIRLPSASAVASAPIHGAAHPLVTTQPPIDPRATEVQAPPTDVGWWPPPRTGRVVDDFGHLVEQFDAFGRKRRWRYDANGNAVHYADFDGGTWTYEVGSWNLRMAETDPIGRTVRYEYNELEQPVAFVDGGGTRTEYQRDFKDAIVEIKRHGVVRDRYVRDASGKLLKKHASDDRVLLEYEYASTGLPTKRRLAKDEEHVYQYDDRGRYAAVATPADRVEFEYDAIGNERLEKRNGRGVEHQFRGRRVPGKSTWFDRFVLVYERNANGGVTITDAGGKKHEVRVRPNGLVERRYSNNTTEASQYGPFGRCLFKSRTSRSGRQWHRRYEWSGEGELRQVEDSLRGTTTHEYDAAHRLRRRKKAAGPVEEYELDAAGNLLSRPGTRKISVADNRIQSVGSDAFAYNDRNHIAVRRSANGETRFHYDSADQLVRVESPSGTWQAEYDGLGRRTRKTVAGRTTEFFWNSDQLAAEIDQDGRLRLYVYADPLALTPILFLDYDSVDAPVESGRRYFVFSDQIGTPRSIEDESGVEVWSADVDPYGVADVAQDARIQFNLRFPGHYWDAEIGLCYNRFRYYDPALGRYIQSDPLGLAGGHNVYAYCANPLGNVDVRGLGCWSDETKKALEEKGFVILEEKDCNLVVKSPKGFVYDLTPGDPSGKIRFGQIGVSPEFSSGGRFKGAKIEEVAAQLISGDRSPDELPVQYIWVNGEKVVVNNRSLTTLSKAGKQPTVTEDKTGTLPESGPDPAHGGKENPDSLPSVLERLDEMDGKPSDTMPVRNPGGRNAGIAEVVPLPD